MLPLPARDGEGPPTDPPTPLTYDQVLALAEVRIAAIEREARNRPAQSLKDGMLRMHAAWQSLAESWRRFIEDFRRYRTVSSRTGGVDITPITLDTTSLMAECALFLTTVSENPVILTRTQAIAQRDRD